MGHRSARIAVRLPSELRERLDAEASARGVTYSQLVKLAIQRLLTDTDRLARLERLCGLLLTHEEASERVEDRRG